MDIKLLKTDILSNNIPKFMIFIDNEYALCKQYIKYISNTTNKAYKYYNTADEVLYDITTNLKEDYVYIIYNDLSILKNLAYIDKLILTNKNIIVYYNEFNKCLDKYKEYVVKFNKLDKYTILAYLIKVCNTNKVSITTNKLETLIDYCNCDLNICLNELDKIISLNQENSNILFDYMLNNGFSDYRHTSLDKLIDKILNNDISVYNDIYKINESPISILIALYNRAKYRFLSLKNTNDCKLMKCCSDLCQRIIDGTISDTYAIKYLLNKCYNE